MLTTSPVMYVASEEARNRMGMATSSGRPNRRSGMAEMAWRLQAAVLQHRPRHVRLDPPRRHTVHKNMMRGKLRGEAFHQTNHSSFGRSVMGVKRLAALAGGGGYHDDAAAPLADHVRDGVVDDRINALQVDRHHFVPFPLRHFFDGQGRVIPDAGVRHQDVQSSKMPDRCCHQALGVHHLRDVRAHGNHLATAPARSCQILRLPLRAQVTEHHPRAGLGKKLYRSRADAARAAGDNATWLSRMMCMEMLSNNRVIR